MAIVSRIFVVALSFLPLVPRSLAFCLGSTSLLVSEGRLAHSSSPIYALTATGNLEPQGHVVKVSYEGQSCDVVVEPEETILAAIERARIADRLAIHSVPSDCRRGNCLTCSATHTRGSEEASLQRGKDGLSPAMSKEVQDKGYVLTCSSYVKGDGLKLSLGQNDDVWQDIYSSRFQEEAAQLTGREASARAVRLAAERNVPKWTRKTEKVLQRSQE